MNMIGFSIFFLAGKWHPSHFLQWNNEIKVINRLSPARSVFWVGPLVGPLVVHWSVHWSVYRLVPFLVAALMKPMIYDSTYGNLLWSPFSVRMFPPPLPAKASNQPFWPQIWLLRPPKTPNQSSDPDREHLDLFRPKIRLFRPQFSICPTLALNRPSRPYIKTFWSHPDLKSGLSYPISDYSGPKSGFSDLS